MRSQTRSGSFRGLSRRSALGLGIAVVGVSAGGCAVNNPLTEERTPAARATRDLDPDVAVAVAGVTLVRGALAAVTATGQSHPALGGRLAGLVAMHQAHLSALVDAVPHGVDTSATGPAYVVPPRPAAALAGVGTVEHSVHDGLVGLAMRAQSGPFARLLGSMAAAVSQQLQVLGR